jgi:zinc protease
MRRTLALAALLALGMSGTALAAAPPIYEHPDAAVPLADISLWLPAGAVRDPANGGGLAALTAETLLHALVTPRGAAPESLANAIADRGGFVTETVSTRGVRFALIGAPEALPQFAALFAAALAVPPTDAAVADARTALDARIAEETDVPVLAGLDALRGAYYADGAARPVLGSAASLAMLGAADVQRFRAAWYISSGAFVSTLGPVGSSTQAAAKALVAALPVPAADALVAAIPQQHTHPFGSEPRRIVIRRDISSPYVVVGFAAPAMNDPDFAAALVVRSLLTGAFTSRESSPFPALGHASGAIYAFDAAPGHFVLWIDGARIEPAAGLAAMSTLLEGAAKSPLSAAALTQAKNAAGGDWLLDASSLDDRSERIVAAVDLGMPADAPDAVPAAISGVTAADVQRVAKRWFAKFDIALITPREGPGN